MKTAMDLVPLLMKEGAPLMASYLGSPLSGVVVALIASHYGLPRSASVNDIHEVVSNNPLHLRSLEYDHREFLAQLFEDAVQKSNPALVGWIVGTVSGIPILGALAYLALHFIKG